MNQWELLSQKMVFRTKTFFGLLTKDSVFGANTYQARLAVNSVTLGDYDRPVQIGNFIKDLFAGFQLLNLKNDILRKRSDGIKYSVSSTPAIP